MPFLRVFVFNDKTHEWSKGDYFVVAIHTDSMTVLIKDSFFDVPFNRIKWSQWSE